ncbi:hypothetical protein protein [Bacillus cereus G9241]|nr:hypothetical protein protein [Bacillus cereus G9241]
MYFTAKLLIPLSPFYRFSAILNFAERARLFSSNSISEGKIGFLVISFNFGLNSSGIIGNPGGNCGVVLFRLNVVLQIRSSKEWNVITLTLPPGLTISIADSNASSNTFNSSFTAIRIAWNTRFAGCPPVLRAGAGIPSLISSTNSPVVSIALFSRYASIFLAICFENFSSPYWKKILTSCSYDQLFTTS